MINIDVTGERSFCELHSNPSSFMSSACPYLYISGCSATNCLQCFVFRGIKTKLKPKQLKYAKLKEI